MTRSIVSSTRISLGIFVVAMAAVACSSSGSIADNAPVPNGSFTFTAGSAGNGGCSAPVTALVFGTTLSIACSPPSGTGANPDDLNLPDYHGTDSYTFTATNTADAGTGADDSPFFYVTAGGLYVGNTDGTSGTPATTCTITLTGPATLSKGSEVKGHVHCDNMETAPPEDPSQPYVSPTIGLTVDADFDAFDPLAF